MRILVTGATGYIGGRIVPKLLEQGHTVRCVTRETEQLRARFGDSVEIVSGDLADEQASLDALAGIEVAYYLVHSMTRRGHDFAQADRHIAQSFSTAAKKANVGRIIYLGGLGDRNAHLSDHLHSRNEVGDILRSSGVPVTELRAAVIVGAGSASFEMIRNLAERLPAMIAPRWVSTLCQPIWIMDVVNYLVQAADRIDRVNKVYDIGGADVLSYLEMIKRYAKIRGISRTIFVVPVLTPRLSSYWVHLVTPLPASLARALIDGLSSEVIVRDDSALKDFSVKPIGYAEAVTRALDRENGEGPETTWFDALDVQTLPGEFTGLSQGMLIDRRMRRTTATAEELFSVFTSLGGSKGWLYADALWEIRGIMDLMIGGVGTRRGRRSQTELRVGDALDFWRVEAYEKPTMLRLRAEMKLPGVAWLQFEAVKTERGVCLRQTAFYEPKGVMGHLYWYSVLPFHEVVFGNMATRIVELAEGIVKKDDPHTQTFDGRLPRTFPEKAALV